MRKVCLWIMKTLGWSWSLHAPDYLKSVICVAPHTSNWDFIIGKLFYTAVGRNANFLIKKDWFVFPFNLIFKPLGGIPVDRGKKLSLVDQMVKIYKEKERFNLAITPEGTRKRNENWKKGFYYIALQANVPIVLTAFDYDNKRILMDETFFPTGNEDEDIVLIKKYFRKFGRAKHPKNFETGLKDDE